MQSVLHGRNRLGGALSAPMISLSGICLVAITVLLVTTGGMLGDDRVGVVRYVNLTASKGGGSERYTTPEAGALSIESGLAACLPGDRLILPAGNYVVSKTLVIPEGVCLESESGPIVTVIDAGFQCRVVELEKGSILKGVTVRGGSADTAGGIFAVEGALVERCVITGNRAIYRGAGIVGGTIRNSLVSLNSAWGTVGSGGGIADAHVYNCTVVQNDSESSGGGIVGGDVHDTIVAGNRIDEISGADQERVIAASVGDTVFERLFRDAPASDFRLAYNSPAIDAGGTLDATGADLEGCSRKLGARVDVGCYEYAPTGLIGLEILTSYTNVSVGFPVEFSAKHRGAVSGMKWIMNGDLMAGTSNQMAVSYRFEKTGIVTVVAQAWNAEGSVSSFVHVCVQPLLTHHVSVNGRHHPPFVTKDDAARSIQAAIDVALPGAVVLVHDGTYDGATHAADVAGASSAVTVNRPVKVVSENGPFVTTIRGGVGVRCVELHAGTRLEGFTLTGAVLGGNGVGGGALCSSNAILERCIVTENTTGNQAAGVHGGIARSCLITGNTASNYAGGASFSLLENCTLLHNTGKRKGGTLNCTLINCIVVDNIPTDVSSSSASHTCASDVAGDRDGNVNGNPFLEISTGRHTAALASSSPCIDAGVGADWMRSSVDIAGNPRVMGAAVDMGAFESP